MNELITQVQLGEIKANLPELKSWVETQLENYKGLVFTEDTVKSAKETRATLNKLIKAIDDEKKRVKKQYLTPLDDFETEVKQILNLISDVNSGIGNQITYFEDLWRQEKQLKVKSVWEKMEAKVSFDLIKKEAWFNQSTPMSSIGADLQAIKDKMSLEIEIISSLPGYSEHMLNKYYETLSLDRCKQMSQDWIELNKKPEPIKETPKQDLFEYIEELNEKIFDEPSEESVLDVFAPADVVYKVTVPGDESEMFELWLKNNNIRWEK